VSLWTENDNLLGVSNVQSAAHDVIWAGTQVRMNSRVSSLGVTRNSLGDDEEFVRCEFSRSSAFLPKNVARVLSMCAKWDTPDGHAIQIANDLGLAPVHIQALKSLLSEFVEKQLLTCEETVRSDFRRAAQLSLGTEGRVDSVVIVSRNRPDRLLRCVQSYVENVQLFKRAIDFVVFDDSDELAARRQTVEALSAMALPSNVNLFYYGPEQKAELARRLSVDAKCKLEIVQFAVCSASRPIFSAGASRNAALLTTYGQMFVTVDDDTVCDAGELLGFRPGLQFSSAPDPTEWWFVPDRDAAHRLAPARELDIIGCYERLLGKTVASLVDSGEELHLGSMGFSFFRRAMESNASIGLCGMGVKGDRILEVPVLYLALEGASYDRLVASEMSYRNAFSSREAVRCVPQITISDTASCTTHNLGIDNRKTLPPFLPQQRGEDILFCLLVNMCRKDIFSGHLPVAILHDADPNRAFASIPVTNFVPGMQSGDLMAMLMECFARHLQFQSEIPEENLLAFGRYFRLLGAQSDERFYRFVQREWLNRISLLIASLKKRIAQFAGTAPAYWITDQQKHLEVLKAALLRETPVPLDMLSDTNAPRCAWESFRTLLFSYGRLLETWPALIRSAAALNLTPHSCAIAIRNEQRICSALSG